MMESGNQGRCMEKVNINGKMDKNIKENILMESDKTEGNTII